MLIAAFRDLDPKGRPAHVALCAAKRGDRTGSTTGLLNGQAAGGSMGRFAGEGDGVCGTAFQSVADVELRWSWTPFPACEAIVIDIVIVIAAGESYETSLRGTGRW